MEHTKIAWADHTFNPWEGCTKVSDGCKNCYAENRNIRFHGGRHWGSGAHRRTASAPYLKKPFAWNGDSVVRVHNGLPALRVFSLSMGDWLDEEVPTVERALLLHTILCTPDIAWILLTKRPQNWRKLVTEARDLLRNHPNAAGRASAEKLDLWLHGHPINRNQHAGVWLGTSVENQDAAEARIPELYEIPADVHWISCEPLLEELDLAYWLNEPIFPLIDWVVCGGESGPNARPMDMDWARSLRTQCSLAGVPFFFKQVGGKGADKGGNLLDGRTHLSMPLRYPNYCDLFGLPKRECSCPDCGTIVADVGAE